MSSTAFGLLSLAVLVGFIVGVWVGRARGERSTAGSVDPKTTADPNICKRCGRRIDVNPELSIGALEGMHWLCFHLEYEHDTDPDSPCRDIAGCPWWTIRYYEERLKKLGIDPSVVRQQGLEGELGDQRHLLKDA